MEYHIVKTDELATGFGKKGAGDVVLQREINVSLRPGELIFLLGVNGSGKSTLLRTLLGLHKPMEGSVFYDGVPLKEINEKELSKKVSVVFTGGIDDNYLTVFDVVAMGRYPFAPLSGKLSDEDKKIVFDTLQQVEMSGFSDNIFSGLSDGEKQKVLIARALVQETPFMFFDEPAAFIDAPGKIAIMELLSDIVKNRNKGILLTTHDIDTALRYADKIWLLGKNRPFVEGVPEDLVLNGFIQKYFNHKNIIFNENNATFESNRGEPEKTIDVAAAGIKGIWLENALKRKGYGVNRIDYLNIDNGIICDDTGFQLVVDGKTESVCKSVEDILTVINEKRV